MRERTPSADDTPKRAPPAPSREAASADVGGSEAPSTGVYHTAKLSGIPSASSSDRMVASTQSLEDLGVNHPANVASSNADRQQQQQQLQERYGHAYRSSAQTAQDKRSRLSNVINNLRKKVPDGIASESSDSSRKEEDDRNSVERNLETLEKYVMTVLNGVIKDNEEEDKNAEKAKELERQRKVADDEEEEEEEEEDPTDTAIKSEPSNEGDIEAAVVPRLEDSAAVENTEDAGSLEAAEEDSEIRISQDSKRSLSRMEERRLDIEEEESREDDRGVSRENKENRTLGTIIMDRLSEHQVEERANVDDGRGSQTHGEHIVLENGQIRTICDELLNDLLSEVYRTIDENQKIEDCERSRKTDATESRVEETKDSNVQELSMTGLHCSLPLDKVASVLQNCQASESVASRLSSPSSPLSTQKSKGSSCSTPPVRLLCLYCDRKFLSMSLRQRHTERAHQLGGGRRSERNLRKPTQNCQYCSEKCADTLEALFQHMVSSHGDKYHACVQCSTRYPTREALVGHIGETHGGNTERIGQPEKNKENSSTCKEFCNQNLREKMNTSVRERKSEERESENQDNSERLDNGRTKLIAMREPIDNPASPEFDSSFYSNVSCNIRENLLHHLDGKLQAISSGSSSSSTCTPSIAASSSTATTTTTESKSQQQQQPQQSYYEHSVSQIQFPIDISLTAATPVYSKDFSTIEEYENSSEYAQKASKTSSSSRPRRVSFEKYNFPRKYDGREQWTCSIKDLSKFDISTQLSLRKKQQLVKERYVINRLQPKLLLPCEITEVSLQEQSESIAETIASNRDNVDASCTFDSNATILLDVDEPKVSNQIKEETITAESPATSMPSSSSPTNVTEFTHEFADFMRLKRREECNEVKENNTQEIVYAELSGEWSRMRIYICGACGSKHVTLKEMEEHKGSTHPRVLCSHFELAGDQREHYKHLYLPGRDAPTDAACDTSLTEMICTKCAKTCPNVGELHRHMLECGGDQAWLLGLSGSSKKKCKWRPFGSRSRRRRQRGMKRNIQNSQTQPRVINMERSKERQASTGPRVRPSDRESIQKMLANLPAKRATRKVLQDNMIRSQGRLRNVQTKTRPHMIGDNSSRISRNKAALRNKLLKNAKSIQRNRCRSDNIAAVIESVVRKCHEIEKKSDGDGDKSTKAENEDKKNAKEVNEDLSKTGKISDQNDRTVRPRIVGRPKVLGKRRNVKNPQLQSKSSNKLAKAMSKFVKFKNAMSETEIEDEGEETSSPKSIPKNAKTTLRAIDKDNGNLDGKMSISGIKNKNKLAQSVLKRKRFVDPVTSLNASIKAKSQLRTQDGKFARNPNKNLPAKLLEEKMDDGKRKNIDSMEIKPKLKTMQKLKRTERPQLPRRVTRLSSDSDKMPTLEPVVQIVSSNEEYADKSTNDLPILSPVTSSVSPQDQKVTRISTKGASSKEKESNIKNNIDLEAAPEGKKEQKSTRGRKPKQKTKNMLKQKKINTIEENKATKNNIAALKNDKITKSRRNLSVVNIDENNKEEALKKETIVKRDSRLNKEEVTKETRSNSRSRLDKDSMKLSDIPFEVKKLLGSASKEDLLNTLELASNDSKRSLRQLIPRSRMLQMNDKNLRILDDEADESKSTNKKEKMEMIRKGKISSRKNIEKKNDDKVVKTNLEKDWSSTIVNTIQNEKNQQSKRARKEADNPDAEDEVDGKQTRVSSNDAKGEPLVEIASDSLRKGNTFLGKHHSRNKSIEDEETNTRICDEQSNNENVVLSEKEAEKELDKICKNTKVEGDENSDDRLDSTIVNINLSHLQSETSNLSIDSGKENSLETSMNVHTKVKVGRPKKTWGARREKSSRKRSLNNVIGILTEGMNIPIEAQQNVQVLTVQTSLDNPDRIARNGSVQQPNSGESNVIAVDLAFSELSVLAKNEEESTESEIVAATNANDDSRADSSEKNTRGFNEMQVENASTDVSSKITTTKACSPANDIILDLSRRKPKGKGSFLEKIVSKIAKQKDALLEGEVGSLLDTAADELTSILDEVGPTLTDNTENVHSDEINHAVENNDKNVTVTSSDKELSTNVDSKIQEDKRINIENEISKYPTNFLENLEKNLVAKTETSENQTKLDVSNIEVKNDSDDVDKKVNDTEKTRIESCEDKSITNKEEETLNKNALIAVSQSLIITQKENLESYEKKDNAKPRRKCNKRSLENAIFSRKNKRRSLEIIEDHVEGNDNQKDLQLNDTFVSKEASNKNDLLEKNSIEKISNINIESEKSELLQVRQNKIIDEDITLLNLEKNVTETDESNIERIKDLPEMACENKKLIINLKESLEKIISDKNVILSNVPSTELVEKSADFSILSSNESIASEKSANKTEKKDQTDTNKSSSKRTSKRKSQAALPAISSIDVATDIAETSVKFDETEKVSASLIIAKEQSFESLDVQPIEIGTNSKDSTVSLEKLLQSEEIISREHKETQNTDDLNLVEESSTSLKTTKKRDAKKKSLADEHLELSEDKSVEILPKFDDISSIADSNKQLSVSLENFKIPEVKDVLQGGKKRSPKKKSQSEDGGSFPEHFEANEEPEINEVSNSEEKIDKQEGIEKRVTEKESHMKRLERSCSSGSIGLTSSTRTRSMSKKKSQLSSEDLADSNIRNQGAESTDDLSESSCASESSYFKKKRFAKKKRKEEMMIDDNARIQITPTDSVALKNDKRNTKRKTGKIKSLLDEHLDLSDADDIDIPMDIQASLENTAALENIERQFELAEKSTDLQNEDADKSTNDVEDKYSCHDALERSASNNHDSSDPVTPKKRAAGNFVWHFVHTKTGEILIVEKRKKLTKEAARFFCNVCATSFTRKSSLKKHFMSQLHLSHKAKSSKDKNDSSDILESAEKNNELNNDQQNEQPMENVSEDAQEIAQKLLTSMENCNTQSSAESTKSLDLGSTRQMLEDKLLDEEICKITENMSHNEYVLTDHMTPEEPILSSTPIKLVQKKQDESGRGKNANKKRNKSKKKNLAEEHLILDSPELEKSKINSPKSTNDAEQISSLCNFTSTEETTEKIEDTSNKCEDAESEAIVKSSNEETNSRSVYDVDVKPESKTRRTLRKCSKLDNEEENSVLIETSRFSLRPRRSKNIHHYEESDIETDIYFMDTSMELNSDEIENNDSAQKNQSTTEQEMDKNTLQEKIRSDTANKNSQDAEVAKSKTDSTNDTKKRKRGRPRLKDRIVSNSNAISTRTKAEINEENIDLESKITCRKLDIKKHVDEVAHIDAQPTKRSRGRPRKNLKLITNNSSAQANSSNASQSTKLNHDEMKEKTEASLESRMIIEEMTSVDSLIPNAECSPAVQERASSLSETKRDLSNAEEIQSTESNISNNQLAQRMESADIETDDTVKNCDTIISSIPLEKNEVLIAAEANVHDDENCMLSDKRNEDTNVNILTNLTTEFAAELSPRIIEQAPIDDLKLVESKAIKLDNDEKIQKLTDVSEEKQTKSGDALPEEVSDAKLPSELEDSEDETLAAEDKSLPVLNSHEFQKAMDDLENNSICDEKMNRLESSNKKLSRKSSSKERETDRKRLKTSKRKRKKIKVAELSSDSENEDDRIESAASSKSKIVKSVFGRVFGGEKTDKVKEVLNDWVSRSEDDSDMSRSASEGKLYLRVPIRFSENEHKKEKRYHLSFETKKDTERSPKKKGSDKYNNEIHGKTKSRKKREKDVESVAEERVESPINPTKRKHRESKIRADEKILRTFDSVSPTVSDEDSKINGANDEINNESNEEEGRRHHEKDLNKDRTKDKVLISEDWESFRVDDVHGKSKGNYSHRRRQDERSSSPSQSNIFRYKRRESKTKAGERIWRAFDNEILSSYLSNDQHLETGETSGEQVSEFYEAKNVIRSDNSKNVKQKNNDTILVDQEHGGRGRSRKETNNCRKQDIAVIKISKTKMNKKISRSSDNEAPVSLRDQNTKNEIYGDSVVPKHMNRDQNNLLVHLDRSTNSRKNRKGSASENWHSMSDLEYDQEIGRKDEEPVISHNYSTLTAERLIIKNQLEDLDRNSQPSRRSDNNDNDEEEEEKEESDNDIGRGRISPLYARETPDSSIENSSNEEEEEEEDENGDEEEEEERVMLEDNSRKNSNEFSGEKIIIRSPSSGHRSDVVTIAPTDAIEDNALDVPREIESVEPRQGKILNFDEELFVECCSRLKASSENELRGAKKIKLDHTESYHRRDDQQQGFRVNRDRWRDVESQNSLGSLLESVNQLLGEEMYNSHDRSYRTHGSERSSRSASPDASRIDNLGYEDSLDVAFEHNNKLRDKIQQRMRESENLIASTFGQKINDNDHLNDGKQNVGKSYSSSIHEHEQLSTSVVSNRERESSPGHKNKMNSTLGGLHKALSNLLHSNGKHDHNGPTPMKLLAELACARAPTSTSPEDTRGSSKNHQSVKMVAAAVAAAAAAAAAAAVAVKDTPMSPKRPTKLAVPKNSLVKKPRNPIKELFERKKEINDRKEMERSKAALVELNVQKQRKSKKNKKQQQLEFPLIRRNDSYGGLAEKKKRRDSLDRKVESERIKDVYEFDEEESQMAPTLRSVMSYRSQADKSFETNWSKNNKNIDGSLDAVLEKNYVMDTMISKFQELEKFAPKTKGALKSFQSEDQQQQQQQIAETITGPMDEFVERKQRVKRSLEQGVKSGKIKKRGRSSKKRVRNAWYENDSSDEFRTAAKTEDVGVGISKSQRSCSKGKQNLFAELSTSSESEYERESFANKHRPLKPRNLKKIFDDIDVNETDDHIANEFDNEAQIASNWNRVVQEDAVKNDHDIVKSESEMSDHSLVIDERKITDEARNSDDDADNQYERTFEMDDLYREDSSDAETEIEENEEEMKNATQLLDDSASMQIKLASTTTKDNSMPENELISLEEALNLLDQHENINSKTENVCAKDIISDNLDEVSNDEIVNENLEKRLSPIEMRDDKEEADDDIPALPEKLSSNEKPQKESDHNLPLHVFLSRKVQESKKRKQQQLDKLREEQERILLDFQPTRRQRKCAIGKQGLLAEISSSDEESYMKDNSKKGSDHDKSRKKRESKEKRKERYLEKKHEQMIAKEQKAIEEEILREVGKRKEIEQGTDDVALNINATEAVVSEQAQKKKHQAKEKRKKNGDDNMKENAKYADQSSLDNITDNHNKSDHAFSTIQSNPENNDLTISPKRKKISKSPTKSKKVSKSENGKLPLSKRSKESTGEKSKKTSSGNKDSKERRSSSGKHDSDDEELKTTKSWNKVEEGVGVAIGRRKRTAALQLYYWSSSSDEEEAPEPTPAPEEEEDDRQEQHGWIVGDSHKRMITMLAMEKQLKEKRRRSEDEFEPGKAKSKKHRNSTS